MATTDPLVVLPTRVDRHIAAMLLSRAVTEDRPVAQIVRRIIREWAKTQPDYQSTLESLETQRAALDYITETDQGESAA